MFIADLIAGFFNALFQLVGANPDNLALRILVFGMLALGLGGLSWWLVTLALAGAWWWGVVAFFTGTGTLALVSMAFRRE